MGSAVALLGQGFTALGADMGSSVVGSVGAVSGVARTQKTKVVAP